MTIAPGAWKNGILKMPERHKTSCNSPWNSWWFWIPIAEWELLMHFRNFRRHPEKIWNMLGLSIMFPVNPRKYVWLQIQFFYPSCSLNFRRASEINKKIWFLAVWFLLLSAMSLTKIKWARFQRMGTVLQANGNQSPVWRWKKKKTWNISRCRSIEKQAIYIYILLSYTHNINRSLYYTWMIYLHLQNISKYLTITYIVQTNKHCNWCSNSDDNSHTNH